MRRMEVKKCINCGKSYIWESGGIVASPANFMDMDLCSACRVKNAYGTLKRVMNVFKKRDKYG